MIKYLVALVGFLSALSAYAQASCGLGATIMSYVVAGTIATTCVTVPQVDYSRERFPSSWTEKVTTQANLPKGVVPTEIKIDGEVGRVVKTAPVPAVEISWWAKFKDSLGNQYSRVVTSVSTLASFFAKNTQQRIVIKAVEMALIELGDAWMSENGIVPGHKVPSDSPRQVVAADSDRQNVPYLDPAPAASPSEAPGATGLNSPNPDRIYEKSKLGTGPDCARNPSAAWPNAWLDWSQASRYQTPGTTVNYYKPTQVVEVTYKTAQPMPVPQAPVGYTQTAFNKTTTTYDATLTRQVSCPIYKEIRQGDLYGKVAAKPDLVRAVAPKSAVTENPAVASIPGDGIPATWPMRSPSIDWPSVRAPWEPNPNSGDPNAPTPDGVTKPDPETSPTLAKLDFSDAFGSYGDPGPDPRLPTEVFELPSIMGDRWSDGTCPQPHQLDFRIFGREFTVSIDYKWICIVLAFLRPIFLAAGALMAIAIFVDALRR